MSRSQIRPLPLRPARYQPIIRQPIRSIQINATPSSPSPSAASIDVPDSAGSQPPPDAQFEVIGAPFSLLSASVSASQPLYTRKGTLVGFNGKAENAVSTLSVLEPFRRAISGIPFLYQKVSSSSPFTALISTRTPLTTFAVLHLDGRTDWMVSQRNALLAWTGYTLGLKPQFNTRMSLAHWGSTKITGRGLVCLSGRGQVYQVVVKAGEEYIIHPSNVVAYSIARTAPQPYRFKSSSLRLQIPSMASLLPDTRFFRTVRDSQVFRFLAGLAHTIRTWTRRSIFGDRLFLRFEGPANILLQARGSSIADALSSEDVNEMADVPAGTVQRGLDKDAEVGTAQSPPPLAQPTKTSFAMVGPGGKVTFDLEKKA